MIILSTAALIPFKEEERKQEYIDGIKNYLRIASDITDTEVRVIESTGNYIPSFFEDYVLPENVFYTKTNNTSLRNKGVNEFVSLAVGLQKFFNQGLIHPQECIVKVTGRYQLEESNFVRTAHELIELENTHDVVAYHHPDGQIFTGCMAARAINLFDFANSVDYQTIEQHMINIEKVCAYWAEAQRTHFVDRLGVVGKCALGNPFRW